MPESTDFSPPVALTIAGSDNSAGAGAQADLKTFSAAGVYGLTAITCVVAEVPGRVAAIQPVDFAIVRHQIELLARHYPIRAAKTGLLHSAGVISVVADYYGKRRSTKNRPKLVVDPVMVATSGDLMLEADAVDAYRERLFPLAALVTPNLDEVAALLGRPVTSLEAMLAAGLELADTYGVPFLIKGGHLGGRVATDLLVFPGGRIEEFSAPFTHDVATHGTGCTYSAAITAHLARGAELVDAVREAKIYVSAAIREHFRWQKRDAPEVDALNHFPPGVELYPPGGAPV
jgi:hydroxymethylpyrimidine/phosphomethylpyrimidine kinase